ncbi:micrococcal nuclease [Bacillus sp. 491mf]|uniref:thermonuclease family protein n=1 Tax=Bacillus sp. 491mf TaxID=1761755 RepID=UPI0008E9C6FD|nr:thermonuclease family protein [Bacillus sp. 491mf]SFD61495.1 micrococcal nuclease [Bacillus sp. 491mf]
MLKKLVTLLICSVFAFSLAACGNNAKATENKDTKAAEQKKIEEQKKQEEEKKKQEEVKKQQESSTYEDVAVADRENNTPNSTENKVQHESLVTGSIHHIDDEKNMMNTNRVVNATVMKNIDGDTLKVKLENGKEETVRFLLVDTPETKHPRLGVQPFGPEASAFTKKYASEGKKVQLELDVSDREKYGRLLVYVWVDGQMLNRLLVEQGLARVAYIYAPNTKYVDYLREFQTKAQANKKGIWSVENYATDNGFEKSKVAKPATPAPAPKQAQPEPKTEPEQKQQVQQQPNNNLPQGEYHFSSCKEAKAAGFSNIPKGHPAYSSKLDRDGDGIACDK